MAKRIVILGAGISGLAAGFFLMQKNDPNLEIVILENSSQPGGWIHTIQEDGFLFEQGPRSLRTKSLSQEAWHLFEQLGIQKQIIPSDPSASERYIYWQKELKLLPKRILQVPFLSATKGWLQAIIRDLFSKKSAHEDESVYDFFSRKFGSEWTDRLVDPFISGIFAGNAHKLSLKSCFLPIYQMEQQYGSLIKAALLHKKEPKFNPPLQTPLISFQKGMQTIIDALFKRVEQHVILNASVKKLVLEADTVRIQIGNSKWIEADQLVAAIPSYQLAALLSPRHPYLSADLGKLNYASVGVVNFGYWKPVLKKKGYGYLIPSQENESILGCVWDSSVFPQQNPTPESTRLTVMLGGSKHSDVHEWSQEKILAIALASIEKQLQIHEIPNAISIKIAKQAIPQYEIGYQLWEAAIKEQLNFLSPSSIFIGSAFNGISVNECIMGAYQAAMKIT